MYCLPPMETIEEGVAVTVEGVALDELTTILERKKILHVTKKKETGKFLNSRIFIGMW